MNSELLEKLNSGAKKLKLLFTDILGKTKSLEVPTSQFKKALAGDLMFDGSSIDGFVRIEESDMYLIPDESTLRFWEGTAFLICDIYKPTFVNGKIQKEPFEGCPRLTLKKMEQKAANLGYIMNVGPEPEFFLLEPGKHNNVPQDSAGYFDLEPKDLGSQVRDEIVEVLQDNFLFTIEAVHHEVAPGQHEIDFKYDKALKTADNLLYFKFVVKEMARRANLVATFLPKPIYGVNGSGMHCHQSLFSLDSKENMFYDASTYNNLSEIATNYIAGLLEHAKGFSLITNPLVNSYKRLVPGFEAPTNICWSDKNRSLLIRVPAVRGAATRIELRMPDPSCNQYLAFAVMLASGLEGIQNSMIPSNSVTQNVFKMTQEEKQSLGIEELPSDLNEAIKEFEKDSLIHEALGNHISQKLIEAKKIEWREYIQQVHRWELDNYLLEY